MDWKFLLTALALVLILEGLLPFAGPGCYRKLVDEFRRLSDTQLRTTGLALMLSGLLLLYFVRA